MPFGTYYPPDHPKYLTTPGHEASFRKEIEPTFEFKLSNCVYNSELNIYQNALLFSLEGLILIFNNQKSSDSPTEVLAYVPMVPTEEQITVLDEKEDIKKIEIQKVYEFQSYDVDDYTMYEGFKNYINTNKKQKD